MQEKINKILGITAIDRMKVSFSLKLAIIFSVLIAAIVTTLGTFMYINEKNVLESELDKRSRMLARNVANTSVDAMLTSNYRTLRYIMEGVKGDMVSKDSKDKNNKDKDESLLYAFIVTDKGKVMVHTDEAQLGKVFNDEISKKILQTKEIKKYYYNKGTVMEVSVPIQDLTKRIVGYVRIGYSMKPIDRALNSLLLEIIVIIALCIIISLVFCILVAKAFTRPIDILVSATNNLAKGDLTKRTNIKSHDEMGQLGDSFNIATEKLNELIKSVVNATKEVYDFGRKVASGSSETSLISKQVAHTVDELARGFQDQVSTINKVMSTIVELDQLIQEIARKAGIVKEASDNTVGSAHEGGISVDLTIQKFNDINNTVTQLSEIIKDLGGKSIQIGEIVHLISDIADQTNLLALNAAIEAARAGDHGRGFAVVAEEVRKLAEQSAVATKEISALIVEIQGSASKAVKSMELSATKIVEGTKAINVTEDSLKKIMEAAKDTAIMIDEISSATMNQARNSKEVVGAMSSLVASAEQAASSTQEVSASVQEQTVKLIHIEELAKDLDDTVKSLGDKVGQFKII